MCEIQGKKSFKTIAFTASITWLEVGKDVQHTRYHEVRPADLGHLVNELIRVFNFLTKRTDTVHKDNGAD